jgi:hypothetical protein
MLHKFGERAEAHHVLPVSAGGTAHVDNCVVLCRSCHYSAHQGGRWADNSIYETAMDRSGRPARYVSTATIAKEYPFYKFRKANEVELKSSECRRKIGIDDESHGSTAAKTG